jgi:hypothetical protein
MRIRLGISIGLVAGGIAGLSMTSASIAEEPSTKPASGVVPNAVSESAAAQIDALDNQIRKDSRRALELLVRSKQIQAERPRAKEKEDAAARTQRQEDLVKWISDITAMRSELEDHQVTLNAVSEQSKTIRKLDMTDAQVDKLVHLELGVHKVANWLQRGMRELDLALRTGTNALENGAQ